MTTRTRDRSGVRNARCPEVVFEPFSDEISLPLFRPAGS